MTDQPTDKTTALIERLKIALDASVRAFGPGEEATNPALLATLVLVQAVDDVRDQLDCIRFQITDNGLSLCGLDDTPLSKAVNALAQR